MTLSGADIAQLLSAHGLKPSRALGQNFVADPNTVRRIARLSGAGPGSRRARDRGRPGVVDVGAGRDRRQGRGGGDGSPPAPGPALRRRGRRGGGRRGGCPGARPGGAPGRAEPRPLEPGGQPALQRGHAPGAAGPSWRCPRWPTSSSWCSGRWASVWRPQRARRPTGRSRCASPISPGPRWWAGSRPRSSSRGPRVESVLVRLERRPEPAVDPSLVSYERLNAVVRAGFGQRRKMLRRSLAGVVDPAAFERAGVRPDARAEELDVAAWGRLAAL